MAAGGGDVVAEGAAQCDLVAGSAKGGGELFAFGLGHRFKFRARIAVELNQIDVGLHTLQVINQRGEIFGAVVYPLQQHIFKHDAVWVSGGGKLIAQFFQRLRFACRHDGFSHILAGAVQAEGETDGGEPFDEPAHRGGHADGGHHQVAVGQVIATRIAQHIERGVDVFFIVQRLAHAHEHHVAQGALFFADHPHRQGDLIEYFRSGEVAGEAEFARRAKRTVGRASHLRGNTQAGAAARHA